MFILVDQNEKATNPAVVERMRKVFPNLNDEQNLVFGDVNVILDDGNVLAVERKRAPDFLASIADGRVFRQVQQMTSGAKWSIIIIEGQIRFDSDDMTLIKVSELKGWETTNWRGSSVRGAMVAIQWAGCPIIYSTLEMYPYAIADLIRFCSKPDVHHQSLGMHKIVSFPPVTLSEEIIAAFPGVGLKRAKSLLEFVAGNNSENGIGTLAQALGWVSAFPLIAENARPEGWGTKTVDNFRVALGLKCFEYLDIKEDNNQKLEFEDRQRKEKKNASSTKTKRTGKA